MEMDFETPTAPRMVGFAAIGAVVISVVCVLIGEGAAQYVGLNPATEVAADDAAKTARPNFNTIDFATTGSIKGQTIVISPCTGKEVGP
jgi:sugar phosphate permease